MPKYRYVLGTPSQRESDCQRIAVTSRKQSIFSNKVKRCAFLQYGLLVVDDDFHFYYLCEMKRAIIIILVSLILFLAILALGFFWSLPLSLIFLFIGSIALFISCVYVKEESTRRVFAAILCSLLITWCLLLLFFFVAMYMMMDRKSY